jgi:hypothetical protein
VDAGICEFGHLLSVSYDCSVICLHVVLLDLYVERRFYFLVHEVSLKLGVGIKIRISKRQSIIMKKGAVEVVVT